MIRPVAMSPAPRVNMIRYHGVLSSHSSLRREVVPQPSPPVVNPLLHDESTEQLHGASAALLRLMRFLVDERDGSQGLLTSPLAADRFADAFVYHLLCNQPHSHTSRLHTRVSSWEPRHLRRAMEYLDAHAAEPVTMDQLATITGVSTRSLQAAFRRYRDCSPMEFLEERRLALARLRLLTSPSSTVSAIALECGFEHLGRFSAQYRLRFGEAPVETLRRVRQEPAAQCSADAVIFDDPFGEV